MLNNSYCYCLSVSSMHINRRQLKCKLIHGENIVHKQIFTLLIALTIFAFSLSRSLRAALCGRCHTRIARSHSHSPTPPLPCRFSFYHQSPFKMWTYTHFLINFHDECWPRRGDTTSNFSFSTSANVTLHSNVLIIFVLHAKRQLQTNLLTKLSTLMFECA